MFITFYDYFSSHSSGAVLIVDSHQREHVVLSEWMTSILLLLRVQRCCWCRNGWRCCCQHRATQLLCFLAVMNSFRCCSKQLNCCRRRLSRDGLFLHSFDVVVAHSPTMTHVISVTIQSLVPRLLLLFVEEHHTLCKSVRIMNEVYLSQKYLSE